MSPVVNPNRETRRKLEQAGQQPDEFINIRVWIDPKYKDRPVTRKEFMAILTHYHKQQRLRSRLRVAVLSNRAVQWFLRSLFGMKIERPETVAQHLEKP